MRLQRINPGTKLVTYETTKDSVEEPMLESSSQICILTDEL